MTAPHPANIAAPGTAQSGGAFLAETFKAYGVEHIFFVDAILRHTLAHCERLGIQRILAHSEKGAAYMADGYARAGLRPAVCMAQSVGAANLAAGLQDAFFANSPVIALTGRHIANNQYRQAYQELPHEPLFGPVTKFSGRVETPSQMGYLTRHAFRVATSGLTGPVHLDVAGHTGFVADNWETQEPVFAEATHRRVPASRPRGDRALMAQITRMLQGAVRPVIIAGMGVCWSAAQAALRALARSHHIPVLCSLDAKAAMAGESDLDMGITGTYGTDAANHLLDEADFALFVGCDLSDQLTSNWALPRAGVAMAHVGLNADALGTHRPHCIAVLADPAGALEELAQVPAAHDHAGWVAHARELNAAWWKTHATLLQSNAAPIRPERLCAALSEWLPSDALLVADTGYASQWSAQMLQLRPGQMFMRAAGSLGWAFPASLGAKAAVPDRPVVCFTGDGGFMYHLPELETARRCGLHTITVVNNNGCLAQGQRALRVAQIPGSTMADCYQFIQQDFAAIADAFGCLGIVVDHASQLRDAFDMAARAQVPAVIDVRSDPQALAPIPWMPPAA